MKLYRPLKTNRLGQRFGEKKACIRPRDGKVVTRLWGLCPTGYIGLYEHFGMNGHNGWDMGAWDGEPIYHCADWDGVVHNYYGDPNSGIQLDVVSRQPVLDGKHVKIRYAHLKDVPPIVKNGDHVSFGTKLAFADNTGRSSGTHLHWAPKWCDAGGNTIDKNNGFRGAFDPEPYYEDVYVLDVLNVKEQAKSAIDLAHQVIDLVRSFLSGKPY